MAARPDVQEVQKDVLHTEMKEQYILTQIHLEN